MSGTLLTYIRTREWALRMWRKVKRGLALLGAFGLALFGTAFGYFAAMGVRQPDAVLLQLARQIHVADPPSVRDLYLFEFGVGVVLTMWGLYLLRVWFRPVQYEESV
jgi:hypothetical protein